MGGFCGGIEGWGEEDSEAGEGQLKEKRNEKKREQRSPPPHGETDRPFLSLTNCNGEANKKKNNI